MKGKTSDVSRFYNLWQRHLLTNSCVNEAQLDAKFKALINAYTESHRYYHTLGHIEHCLDQFDQVSHLLQEPDAVELSIWYHDIIYQPGAVDNEQRSADTFKRQTDSLFPVEFCNVIYAQILATLHDQVDIFDHDTRYMVDIDLSGFGLPWSEFIRDGENIRREMKSQTDAVYYAKQKSFYLYLLDRPRIYFSEYFFDKYEVKARQNIQHSLKNF
ncbi:MAG: hypothetical protein GY744_04940 [Gammaproteobacteria bacterium]|nr:hypothetical protein [Gammaproteobacteria bacterium]